MFEISYFIPGDINSDPDFLNNITMNTLGIGFGEVWTFNRQTIDLFEGRLFDFMCTRLPQYRGGAHYSWQIMRKNRIGACNLQLINEDMIQGVFDSGEVIKSKEYLFPESARIPQDYFEAAVKEDDAFLMDFVNDIETDRHFTLSPVPEQFSIYFPRLNTLKHGWIDWSWCTEDIATFINAFDDPYAGASTYLDGQCVRLKDVRIEYNDGPFHPFQTGLVYKINDTGIYVASKNGTLIVRSVTDEKGKEIKNNIGTGRRFFTPRERIEKSMIFRADYDAGGLKE
ncbi:hypothetical protein ACFL9T_00130 [Thermodesulfobacteriota bacterium]